MPLTGSELSAVAVIARYFGAIRRFAGRRVAVLFLLIAMTVFAEALGISLFLPFLAQADLAVDSGDRVSRLLASALASVGALESGGRLMVAIAVVFVAKGCLSFATIVYQAYVNSRLLKHMRDTVIAGLAGADYRYMLQRNTGYFTNLLTLEMNRAVTFFGIYLTVLSYLCNVVVFLGVSFLINPRFTGVAFVFGAVVLGAFRTVSTRTRRHSLAISQASAVLQSLAIESVQSFKYLASTGSFQPVLARLRQVTRRLVSLELRVNALSSIIHGFSEPIIVVGMMGLMYYETTVGGASMGSLVVSIMFFYRTMMAITGVQKNWQNLSASAGGIEMVLDAITELERNREVRGGVRFERLAEGLAFEDVSFAYGERPVLQRVSFHVPVRSVVGVVGESGAGKSTLVDLITGTLTPTSGRITVDGRDLSTLSADDWRSRVGYVTQEGVLFDDTVARNISLWRSDAGGLMDEVRAAAAAAHCDTFIGSLPQGYETVIGDRGVRLSGGQRQRLAIARELYKRPELLILDEATSALDVELERDIQASLDALRGQATIIIIAHRLSTVRNCDHILVLEGGRLVEQGSFNELRVDNQSTFARLCALQSVG